MSRHPPVPDIEIAALGAPERVVMADMNAEELEREYAARRARFQLPKSLKLLRKSWGLSQAEMSRRMGVSQRSYAGYENAERSVPSEALVELAVQTKVDLNELFTGEKDRVGVEFKRAFAAKTFEMYGLISNLFERMEQPDKVKLLLEVMGRYELEGNREMSDAQLVMAKHQQLFES